MNYYFPRHHRKRDDDDYSPKLLFIHGKQGKKEETFLSFVTKEMGNHGKSFSDHTEEGNVFIVW